MSSKFCLKIDKGGYYIKLEVPPLMFAAKGLDDFFRFKK